MSKNDNGSKDVRGPLFLQANELHSEGKYFETLDFASAVICTSSNDREIVDALSMKASCYDSLGTHELELKTLDQALARFGEAEDGEIKMMVAWFHYNKGIVLADLGDDGGAVASYDSAIERARVADATESDRLRAMAMFNRAAQLRRGKSDAEARAGLRSLIAEFEGTDDTELLKQVARARSSLGQTLFAEGNMEAARAEFDSLFAMRPEILSQVPEPMTTSSKVMRAVINGMSDQTEEAAASLLNEARVLKNSREPQDRRLYAVASSMAAFVLSQIGEQEKSSSTLKAAREFLIDDESALKILESASSTLFDNSGGGEAAVKLR